MRQRHHSLRGGPIHRSSEGFAGSLGGGIAGMGRSGQVPKALDDIHRFLLCSVWPSQVYGCVLAFWMRRNMLEQFIRIEKTNTVGCARRSRCASGIQAAFLDNVL
jgi:hypothetical protein